MDTTTALDVSARGMEAQTTRLRVIAENLANQDTTGSSPNADPYRRKTVEFANEVDRASGVPMVAVKRVAEDQSALPLKYDPSHPAANADGYVRTPNVNAFVELMDMKEAQRSYSANLTMMQTTRSTAFRTLEMLK
ncbi:MAG TPA: flagellar basal body rod protein FlgC [Acetobacteraceae bacterium]|jgi:flagellar basal-body rod protein FlgC|nr:flagellar basal body rod protein FlgC [Acetobacteraceae bacterium]